MYITVLCVTIEKGVEEHIKLYSLVSLKGYRQSRKKGGREQER